MHGDVPEMVGNVQGKDTVARRVVVTLGHVWESQGLHAMSQQGLMSILGCNSIPLLRTLPQGPKFLHLANQMLREVWRGSKFGHHG